MAHPEEKHLKKIENYNFSRKEKIEIGLYIISLIIDEYTYKWDRRLGRTIAMIEGVLEGRKYRDEKLFIEVVSMIDAGWMCYAYKDDKSRRITFCVGDVLEIARNATSISSDYYLSCVIYNATQANPEIEEQILQHLEDVNLRRR